VYAFTPRTGIRTSRPAKRSIGCPATPEALEDTEYVDFSPTEEFQHVIEHITSGAAPSA
jgi:hypothetical protein